MKDELTESQIVAILKALDDTLTTGPWTESNFLRVIGKKLQETRDSLAQELEKSEQKQASSSDQTGPKLKAGQQEIFISLYSAEGNQMHTWERIIANLPRQMISRPTYTDEDSVKNLIKTKENKLNEAYVVVIVNEDDLLILHPDKIPYDKLGKPLLSLKDRTIHPENIIRFVHVSGVYRYLKGRLVKDEPL